MLSTTVMRTMATALSGAAIAGAIGTPTASAMPIDPVTRSQSGGTQIVAPTPRSTAPAAATPDHGFDLSSAAIGAAAGTGLLIVVLGAGGLALRRPTTRHGAAGA